ncbi:MAG: carboxypeptidase-like regulatory domain-containing protein [Planctomycetes bacterium]|nr:carboxypeptidase-like regulatory domain-containing protein [Planctomycetota bacterium]
MRLIRFAGCGLAVAMMTCFVGCGMQGGRQPVSGSVSHNGQPLNGATVTFFAMEGPPGPIAGALIKDGRFNIPAEHGLEPGTYKVSISMAVPGGIQTPEEKAAGASPKGKEGLPEKYNTATTLTAEVKASGSNHFDFKLE